MKSYPDLIVCAHCDRVYRRPFLAMGDSARCKTCAAVLIRGGRLTIDSWLALTIVAAVAFVMANAMPVMRIGLYGRHGEAMLWQFPVALAHGAAAVIAVPTALSVIAVPGVQIMLLGWLLGFARVGRRAPAFARAMRVLTALRPWSMVEVALLGIVVSIVKLSGYLQVAPGGGFLGHGAAHGVDHAHRRSRYPRAVGPGRAGIPGRRCSGMSVHLRAGQAKIFGCHGCGMVCEDPGDETPARCPRCGTPQRRRRVDSIARAWAMLLAGVIFYIPANLLPVMRFGLLGSGSDNTILGSVIELWRAGAYDIAVVIFVASVGVPCAKFLVLGLLLVTSQRCSRWARRERAWLYRLIERVGYWSMLDVLVVATIAALLHFHGLTSAEPRLGIFFFGATVILTMLSALNFDPRLIWDDEVSHDALC